MLHASRMDMAPTYYLFAGKLFHAVDADGAPTVRDPEPRREDPGPEGPEGEPVGEDDEDDEVEHSRPEPRPEVGPGAPLVPPRGAPDANPIDPRVFDQHH